MKLTINIFSLKSLGEFHPHIFPLCSKSLRAEEYYVQRFGNSFVKYSLSINETAELLSSVFLRFSLSHFTSKTRGQPCFMSMISALIKQKCYLFLSMNWIKLADFSKLSPVG